MTKGLFAGILELGLDPGPFGWEVAPGALRLEAAGKVLEAGAEAAGAGVALPCGPGNFSKVAAVGEDATGEGAGATHALALVSAEAQGVEAL